MISYGVGSLFFFFFAASTIVSGTLVFFFLPETKGRTLEGMDEVFGTPYKQANGEAILMPVVRINSTV